MGFLDALTMVREIDEEVTSLVALRRLLDAAKKGAIELKDRSSRPRGQVLVNADGVARYFDMHAPIPLPNLDPAKSRLRVENLFGPLHGGAIIAALDDFHGRDMRARIQEIASVGMHHGVDLPRFVAASHAYRLIVCSVNDGMRRLLATAVRYRRKARA